MKRTTARIAAAAALTALALAGCSAAETPVAAPTIEQEAEDAPEPADEPAEPVTEQDEPAEKEPAIEQSGPGVYQAELMSGGTATVAVPGEAPADLEAFREKAGADPVGYLVVEVDNTSGADEAMVFEAEIVDSEGKTHTYEEVMSGMQGWTGENYDLMEEEMELWEKYPYSTRPSAINTVPLIGPEVPDDVVSVFIEYTQAERVGDL